MGKDRCLSPLATACLFFKHWARRCITTISCGYFCKADKLLYEYLKRRRGVAVAPCLTQLCKKFYPAQILEALPINEDAKIGGLPSACQECTHWYI